MSTNDRRISELTQLQQPDGNDLLPIVDESEANINKKTKYIKFSDLIADLSKTFVYIFTSGAWTEDGENYKIEISHQLESSQPVVEIKEDDTITHVHQIKILDQNSIKIEVPKTPDLRFAGTVSILKA